jgi:hypothetical protein
MPLSAGKLRGIANLLSDPLQAGAAANILAAEARQRGILVADRIASALVSAPPAAPPPPPEPAAPPTAPSWQDVTPIDDGGPYIKRIGADHIGLVSWIVAETPEAWCAQTPEGNEAWLAKSVVEHHGEPVRCR